MRVSSSIFPLFLVPVTQISQIMRLQKAGLDACTRTWALEVAPYGIRVGGIAPDLVDTPMLNQLAEETRNALIAGIPLQRIGTPHEIWLALKFIIECDYFTGACD